MPSADVQAQIAGLLALKQKQADIQTLKKRIDGYNSKIEQLRKQRTKTGNVDLLPTDNAETLENQFLHQNTTQKKTGRILLKLVLILVILGLLAAMFLLFVEHQVFLGENQAMIKEYVDRHASDPTDIEASPLYYLMLIGGIFGVVALAWTFIPGEYVMATGWFGGIASFLGGIMMIWSCVVLAPLGAIYAAIPGVITLLLVINQFIPWSVDPAALSKQQEQKLEEARELDEQNHLTNQKNRADYAQNLEIQQREQIMDLNDQINDCEDLIDRLEAELADNDLLVGNQLGLLETVLYKLQTGRASSISQAIYGDGTPLETYTAEDEARDKADAKSRLNSYRRQSTAMTDAHIAREDQRQADAHEQKKRELLRKQSDVIDQINEDAKYYHNR